MASPKNVMALLLFATLTLCTLTLCTGQQPLNITSSPSGETSVLPGETSVLPGETSVLPGETSVLPGESAFISMLLCPAYDQHSLKARVSYHGEENSSHHEFVAGKDLSYYETERDGFLITNWTSISPDDVNCTEMVARIINTPLLRSNDHITFTFEVWDVPTRRQVESRTFVVTLLSPTPTTTLGTATTPLAPTATTTATMRPSSESELGGLPQSSTILVGVGVVAGAVLLVVILVVATLVVLRRGRGKPESHGNEEAQANTLGQRQADTADAEA